MQVEADGRRSSFPPDITQNGGYRSLNPSRGGRLQLVTNFKSCCFSSSVKLSTTFQNMWILSWSSLYSPASRDKDINKVMLHVLSQDAISHMYVYVHTSLCIATCKSPYQHILCWI